MVTEGKADWNTTSLPQYRQAVVTTELVASLVASVDASLVASHFYLKLPADILLK